MANLLNVIAQQLSPAIVGQISNSLGINDGATKNVITSALPVIFSALNNNTNSHQGAESLHNALQRDHDGSIFDSLTDLVAAPERGHGSGILGHIFGNKQSSIERNISHATGVPPSGTAKILQILAPMVMGALGKQQRSQGLGIDDLSRVLTQSQGDFTREAPREMGAVARLLDADGDGKIIDDVAGIGMKLLGSFLRR